MNTLPMDYSRWIDRLYSDESLTDNLRDEDAVTLLRLAEERIAACSSGEEAERVIELVREVNRRVGEGEAFIDLYNHLGFSDTPPGGSPF